MSKPATEDVTLLLQAWSAGDKPALNRLMPLMYRELRHLASRQLRRERKGHTLQTTALVHEAYLRLVNQTGIASQTRAQFFAIAANLMRQILVDHARQRHAEKRGGAERQKLSLTNADKIAEQPEVNLLALNEALEQLARLDAQQARVVELKFFGGLTIEETAEVMGISHATVERDWKMARAWLRRELS